jgi:DNA modification methylase
MKDLFGNEIIENPLLRDKFIEPPFSILDTKTASWVRRKNEWKKLNIKSEIGRDIKGQKTSQRAGDVDYIRNGKKDKSHYVSIFDPALCEVLYHWFCPDNGTILDPFAGGSVRGIVANYLNYNYVGVDIRPEQIESNINQANEIIPDKKPLWICGDSDKEIDKIQHNEFDMIFTCPPYADLEVYSDIEGDISNMNYDDFLCSYRSIIEKACRKLKKGGFAVFVVGEVRDKKSGNYIGFVPDTIKAFQHIGMDFYNEAILLNPIASASMRANGNMKTKKLVKIHQNVLVFKKDA